jgi:polysaccharide biosynthesis transport protein
MTTSQIKGYARLARRWAWLIALFAIAAGSFVFINGRTQPNRYQSTSTVRVGNFLETSTANTSQIMTGQMLVQNYAAVVRTYPVLEATVNALQLPFSPDALIGLITTQIVPQTTMLRITITDTDPVRAADIANELANQLIAASPTAEQRAQVDLLTSEIRAIEQRLGNLRTTLSQVETDLATGEISAERRSQLLDQQSRLSTQISESQTSLANLQNARNQSQNQGGDNILTLIESARISPQPLPTNTASNTIFAMLIAAFIGFGVAVGIDYLNDSIRTPSEIPALTGTGLVGTVPPYGKKGTYKDKLIAHLQPRSVIAEYFRALRVNLVYALRNDENRHLLFIVTSPNPSEGKSVTAANTAVAFANTGMRVLLIDADLRRPSQHNVFGLPNEVGLANLLSSDSFGREGELSRQRVFVENIVQKTSVAGLEVITGGPTPQNPTELLGTVQVQALTRLATEELDYDVIIYDTPPALSFSDSVVLASTVSAPVMIVTEARRTRRSAAAQVVQKFLALEIPVAGVVLNRLNPNDVDPGDNYYYYGYYGYYGYGSKMQGETPRPMPVLPGTATGPNQQSPLNSRIGARAEPPSPTINTGFEPDSEIRP